VIFESGESRKGQWQPRSDLYRGVLAEIWERGMVVSISIRDKNLLGRRNFRPRWSPARHVCEMPLLQQLSSCRFASIAFPDSRLLTWICLLVDLPSCFWFSCSQAEGFLTVQYQVHGIDQSQPPEIFFSLRLVSCCLLLATSIQHFPASFS
jgi:hypothetical protein